VRRSFLPLQGTSKRKRHAEKVIEEDLIRSEGIKETPKDLSAWDLRARAGDNFRLSRYGIAQRHFLPEY
jgi:hypothetical protein